jgi:hypothetical protein
MKLWEAQTAGLKSQLQDLEAELQEYETLKTGGRGRRRIWRHGWV